MNRDYAYSALYPLAISRCPSQSINMKQTYFIHVNIIHTRNLDHTVQRAVEPPEKHPWPSSMMRSHTGLRPLRGPSYSHWQGSKELWIQGMLLSARSPLRDDFPMQKDVHFLFPEIWPLQKPEQRAQLSAQGHPSGRLWGGGGGYGEPVG